MKRDFSEDKKQEIIKHIEGITPETKIIFEDYIKKDQTECGEWAEKLDLRKYSSVINAYDETVADFNTSVKSIVETKFENIANADIQYQKVFQELYNTIWFQLCKVNTLKNTFDVSNSNTKVIIKCSAEIRAEEILLDKMKVEGVTDNLEKQNIIQIAKMKYPQMMHNLYVTDMNCSSSCNDVYEQIRSTYENEKSCINDNKCTTLDGWLCLYSKPTVAIEGRVVLRHPDADPFNWACPCDLISKKDIDWFATESHAKDIFLQRGENMEVKLTPNNLYTNAEGRYWVAVGPNIINPYHTPADKSVTAEEMKFGTKIDIVVKDEDGEIYYIPAVIGEGKEHSYPDGLYQTGIPFNSNRISDPAGAGNTVEFIGYDIDKKFYDDGESKFTINITNNYELVKIIVYDESYL